jgi:hypothetical protein
MLSFSFTFGMAQSDHIKLLLLVFKRLQPSAQLLAFKFQFVLITTFITVPTVLFLHTALINEVKLKNIFA